MSLFGENRQFLLKLENDGVSLVLARAVDFSVLFFDEASAQSFARCVAEDRFSTKVDFIECGSEPWDVTVTNVMIPDCLEISNLEMMLGDRAELFGGRMDGWGFFGQ